jgi:hypothetical protein
MDDFSYLLALTLPVVICHRLSSLFLCVYILQDFSIDFELVSQLRTAVLHLSDNPCPTAAENSAPEPRVSYVGEKNEGRTDIERNNRWITSRVTFIGNPRRVGMADLSLATLLLRHHE